MAKYRQRRRHLQGILGFCVAWLAFGLWAAVEEGISIFTLPYTVVLPALALFLGISVAYTLRFERREFEKSVKF